MCSASHPKEQRKKNGEKEGFTKNPTMKTLKTTARARKNQKIGSVCQGSIPTAEDDVKKGSRPEEGFVHQSMKCVQDGRLEAANVTGPDGSPAQGSNHGRSSGGGTMEVPVLQHFNLTAPPGEVVAIVGLSGSGKRTVVNLLLRIYEPTNGEILIDGYPMKELNVRWLRERIGYMGQEPRLFCMDISSNIKYGCPRDVSQQDVEWAAKQAFAHDFISSMPNGYQTLVDDDLLSGGQKQRSAIARGILRDPNILILDEATSALEDAESEHNVKGVLRAVQRDLNRVFFVLCKAIYKPGGRLL